jgi:heptosyltransferase-1
MSEGILASPPKAILMVRLGAHGDVVFASPLVRAFRRTHPDARLVWLIEDASKGLVEHHPELDEVIVWDRTRWRRLARKGRLLSLAREIGSLLRRLRSPGFDLALDLQGLLRSGLLTFLSGAESRIGLGSREGSSLLMTSVLDRRGGDRSQVSSEYRFLAEELGLDLGDFAMEVPLSPEDRAFATATAGELGHSRGYAALAPFTTRPQKHWFEERWARVIDRLEEIGLPSVLLGGPSDHSPAERILGLAEATASNMTGKTTLTQAAALVAGASLVLGVDTGLTHMGVALERPTVLILGSTIPYSDPPSDRVRILLHRMDCSPCRRNPTCDGDYTCLRLITEDEVVDAAGEILPDLGTPEEASS